MEENDSKTSESAESDEYGETTTVLADAPTINSPRLHIKDSEEEGEDSGENE